MSRFEYKAVPAPTAGTKAKGVKTTEDRFALALTGVLNAEADEGWEYVRAETLPCDERKGLTGTITTFQNILVFRRPLSQPLQLETVTPQEETVEDVPPMPPIVAPPSVTTDLPEENAAPPVGAARDPA